jgi:hypothetical protein
LTPIRVYGPIQKDAGATPHPGNSRSRFRADSPSLVLLTPAHSVLHIHAFDIAR